MTRRLPNETLFTIDSSNNIPVFDSTSTGINFFWRYRYCLKDYDFIILLGIPVLYVAALICSLIVFISSLLKKRNAQELLRINMVIKLLHIPSYIIIFTLGLMFSLTIFTIGITIVFMIWDCLTIVLSGLIGLGCFLQVLSVTKCNAKV